MWHWNPRMLLDRLHAERVGWFGAGLGAAGIGLVGYQLLLASTLAAASPPPRPTPLPVRVTVGGEVGQPGEILADLVRETGGVGPAVGDLSVLADLQRVGAGGGEEGCVGGGTRFVGVEEGTDGCGVGAGGAVSAGATDAISVRC